MKSKWVWGLLLMMIAGGPIWAQEVDLQGDSLIMGAVQSNAPGFTEYTASVSGVVSTASVGASAPLNFQDATVRSLQSDDGGLEAVVEDSQNNVELKLLEAPLCYPNPAKQNEDVYLQYYMTRSADLDVYIYDMMANLVVKYSYTTASQGGLAGKNIVKIQELGARKLSVGVYFAFIMNGKQVLGRTKFAVIP